MKEEVQALRCITSALEEPGVPHPVESVKLLRECQVAVAHLMWFQFTFDYRSLTIQYDRSSHGLQGCTG